MKNLKGNIDRLVSKIINETLEEKADDIVNRIKSKMDEKSGDVCEQCGGSMNEGECSECGYMKEETFEELFGGQKKLDVAEPKGKLTSADFKKLRSKKKENKEGFGGEFDYVETEEAETEEGNAFTGALAKAKKEGDDTFTVDGKKYNVKEEKDKKFIQKAVKKMEKKGTMGSFSEYCGGEVTKKCIDKAMKSGDPELVKKANFAKNIKGYKGAEHKESKLKESIQLTEDELIDVIEKLVKEETEKQKDNIKKGFKTRGMSEYEKSVGKSKSDTDDYIKSVTKKMKDYLKDASKGEYETNPKIYPAGNGQLKKMDKKAYVPSDAVQEYTDNFTAAGQENLVYDEIHPNEEWVSDNIEGSSRTGNNPKWANAVETPTNKKRNQIRKDNLLGQVKSQAYNKAPQPIVKDEAGESNNGGHMNLKLNKKANKVLNQLESVDEKQDKLIKEEFNKINRLMNYNQKTQ